MVKVVHTSGKRKSAVARATLKQGKGNVFVNRKRLDFYGDHMARLRIQEPLLLIGDQAKTVDVRVQVNGGGVNGQVDAACVAIARDLAAYDIKMKTVFDDYDRLLLVADVRRKEPRKPGRHSKARSKTQKSYR